MSFSAIFLIGLLVFPQIHWAPTATLVPPIVACLILPPILKNNHKSLTCLLYFLVIGGNSSKECVLETSKSFYWKCSCSHRFHFIFLKVHTIRHKLTTLYNSNNNLIICLNTYNKHFKLIYINNDVAVSII